MKKLIISIGCLIIVLGIGFGPEVQARTVTHSWEDSYVSYLEGSAFGRYSGAEEFETLQKNMPLEEGIQLVTDQGSLMELRLYGGTTAWMDAETAFSVEELFKRVHLSLHEGDVFIRHPQDSENRFAVEVSTPAARVKILPGSLTRVSLDAGGEVLVEVWEGSADVSGRHGEISLVPGKRVRVTAGGDRFQAALFSPQPRGAFERTCLQRDHKITVAQNRLSTYLNRPVRGLSDLDGYGVWIYESHIRSYVWRPYVDCRWRPFMYGRWRYHARGPYWVSADPWGWAPYHYGRWIKSRRGYWCWLPGYRFSPARVAFFLVGGCYVWAPAGYFGQPFCGHHPGCACGGFVYSYGDCLYDPDPGPGHGKSRYHAMDDVRDGPNPRVTPVAVTPLSIAQVSKAAHRIKSGLQKASQRLRDRLSENKGQGLFARAAKRVNTTAAKRKDLIKQLQQRKPLRTGNALARLKEKRNQTARNRFQVMPVRKVLADIKKRDNRVAEKIKNRLPLKSRGERETLLAKARTRRPLKKVFRTRSVKINSAKSRTGPLSGREIKRPLSRSRLSSPKAIRLGKSGSLKPGAVRRGVQKKLAGRVSLGKQGGLFRR